MSTWEFDSQQKMFNLLVGNSFGEDPESNLTEIRAEKRRVSETICSFMGFNKADKVVEIGSGCGFISRVTASQVKHLFCCDVSSSFLEVARHECASEANLSFHKIISGKLHFLEDAQVDGVYAYNVFIHLNLYDIAMYLKELGRVVKPGGRVWFDIYFTETFSQEIPEVFSEMLGYYAKDPDYSSKTLVQFNSRSAVMALAKLAGFSLAPAQLYENSLHLVRK